MKLRLAHPDDAPACLDIYRPIVTDTAISFEISPPDGNAFAERISSYLEFAPWLVATEDEAIVGYAYASRFRPRPAYQWTAEVTVYVAEAARERKVGRTLYKALLDAMRLQGFLKAYALITLPNPGSVTLHERMGFRKQGVLEEVGFKLGRWHDVGWWTLPLNPVRTPPPPLGSVETAVAAVLADFSR